MFSTSFPDSTVPLEDAIRSVDAAIQIVDAFLNSPLICSKAHGIYKVLVNKAQVLTYSSSKRKCLIEPFIENFNKFNSNSGAIDNRHSLMHALSHFSYHHSDGERLLCDLQGGVKTTIRCCGFGRRKTKYTISNPVIMSHKKEFGITDLGQTGIENFFHYHQCTHLCSLNWLKPQGAKCYLKPTWSSTMILQGLSRLTISAQKVPMPSFGEEKNYKYFADDTMLNPAEIRYCQDSIKRNFIDGRDIADTKRELERDGDACVNRIPKIRVFKRHGEWFSDDNRRLWCFKNASNIHSVPVTVVKGISDAKKFTTTTILAPKVPVPSFAEEKNYRYFTNETMLNPAEIRYCQDSIMRYFIDRRPIADTKLELERDGTACVNRIPRIRVFKRHGEWFSEDNRRLWCFKNASNIHSVPVAVLNGISFEDKFTTMNNGASIRLR